jgi:type VI secretion system protein ImpD
MGMTLSSAQIDRGPAPAAEAASPQPAAGVAAVPAQPRMGLLDVVLDSTTKATPWLDDFLAEGDWAAALRKWLARAAPARPSSAPRSVSRLLGSHIAAIDAMLTRQVNEIIHQEAFQRLEASWRGLRFLVEQTDPEETIKVRVLNVSWRDLARDLDGALEFDQSQLFRKVYSDEFGTAGGEPFSVLIGDYFTGRRMGPNHKIDDVAVLKAIAQVAAASFAPFITASHPELMGLSEFSQLERPMDAGAIFNQPDYIKWRAFRESEDSRFVGLVLPRVLARAPYADENTRVDAFRFQEDVEGPDRSRYLWGNAAYGFGAVLIRAYQQSGWMAEIRGYQRDAFSGGLVAGLPRLSLPTDHLGTETRAALETLISDPREKELSDLGFIPLCHCKDTDYCVFYSNQSAQKPKVYDKPEATLNAKMSAMLQYILCVSRFAHYLKVLARDKIGSMTEASQLEGVLRNWLTEYIANDANASPAVRARYPLREADVQVRESPGKPGSYQCIMHLLPHTQLDALTLGIKLATELVPSQT